MSATPLNNATKEQLALIYRNTPKDYRSTFCGERSILVCRGATCIVPLSQLTQAEVDDRLASAKRREEQQRRAGQ